MIFSGHPELMVAAQNGAPLAVGFGDDEMFIGSDALALAPLTRRIAYLHDGDWTVVTRDGATFLDMDGNAIQREIKLTRQTGAAIGKGNFRHFMEKELHEHPAVIGDTLHRMVNPATRAVALPDLGIDFATLPRITMSACGSAFYAGLVGRWWFEAMARIPMDGDVASEFRYRAPPLPKGGLGLLVSQSGETADTLAALRYMRENGQTVLSILNVPESSMARESDATLETVAGPEIGVASTKAFTAQLSVLACLALAAGRARGAITAEQEAAMTHALLEVPARAAEVLERDAAIHEVAALVAKRPRRAVPGPRQLLPDRAGGRAEAEGDQLHPRRGLRRRRDEARPDRPDRQQRAGHRHRPLRPAVREDGVEFAGGGGPRRPGDRVQRRRRSGEAAGHRHADRWCCRRSIPSWRRSSTPSPCRCWPIRSRC